MLLFTEQSWWVGISEAIIYTFCTIPGSQEEGEGEKIKGPKEK